jgi:hypothetical protein
MTGTSTRNAETRKISKITPRKMRNGSDLLNEVMRSFSVFDSAFFFMRS